jgi:hypothetical protein
MKSTKALVIAGVIYAAVSPLRAQTLYAPAGTVGASSNSFVGVGISTPNNPLTVLADVSSAGSAQIEITPPFGGGSSQSRVSKFRFRATFDNYPTDQGPRVAAQIQAGYQGGVWGTEYLAFQVGNSDDTSRDPSEQMRITAAGNVGIGTTSPQSKLEIDGRITIAEGNRYWSLGAARADGSSNGYPDAAAVSNDGAFAIRDVWMQRDRLRIDYLGNVGIGTTKPDAKLAVNGTIHAKEVIVDTSSSAWSDYVFAPDYRLAPLSEVEQHIKAEGHLPGIPSASDVAEHGITVGEMQAKLLAKIEELTLHQINQEKRIENLEQENRELRSELSAR